MLTEPHDLVHELPEHKATIVDLKKTDNHFAKLLQKYEDINKDILRIEKGAEASSDERLEGMKKLRLQIKDEMVTMIRAV